MPGHFLPIFPLEVALLPHERLPLHIFEDRYKEMIGECLEQGSEFGVVLRRNEGILRSGCSASIEQVTKRYSDGRMDILTVGRRRFEIEDLDTERSYLRAEVKYIQDSEFDEPSTESLTLAMTAHEVLSGAGDGPAPAPNAPEMSFRLAAVSNDRDFRQLLLSIRSEAERMTEVAKHLSWLVYKRRTQRAMKKVARSNGHGKHVSGIGGGM